MHELKDLYEAYRKESEEVYASAKLGAGLFGLGAGPKDDPCHMEFLKHLHQKVEQMVQKPVSAEEAFLAADWILSAQGENEQVRDYWVLLAAHTEVLGLVPLLTPEDSCRLAQEYAKRFPKARRLPAMNRLLSELQKRGNLKEEKPTLLGKLFGR